MCSFQLRSESITTPGIEYTEHAPDDDLLVWWCIRVTNINTSKNSIHDLSKCRVSLLASNQLCVCVRFRGFFSVAVLDITSLLLTHLLQWAIVCDAV